MRGCPWRSRRGGRTQKGALKELYKIVRGNACRYIRTSDAQMEEGKEQWNARLGIRDA